MEAYDISNINGFENVGSMVVFEKGKPKTSDYRKFKIKTVSGPDDYACMREVLTRRFTHGLEESEALKEKDMEAEMGSFTKFPDLIMMDGGRGQNSVHHCRYATQGEEECQDTAVCQYQGSHRRTLPLA